MTLVLGPLYHVFDKEERAKVKAEKERNEQLTATNAQLDLQNKQQAHEIDQLKPIADYAQLILSAPGLMTTNQIAKDYGKSAMWMNRMLNGLGVQYKQNDQWCHSVFYYSPNA